MVYNRSRLVRAVMNEFDFGKVKMVMDILNWKWITSDEDTLVPSIKELQDDVEFKLYTLINEYETNGTDDYEMSSGGIQCSMSNVDDTLILECNFVLESADIFFTDLV